MRADNRLYNVTPNILKSILSIALIVTIFALIPLAISSDYILSIIIRIFIWAILTQCWNILSGYTGYVNVGMAAFYGLGAYIWGIAFRYLNIPFSIALLLAIIVPTAVGLLVGGVSLRLRGTYFTVTTLMLILILGNIFYNISSFIPGATSEIWVPAISFSIGGMSAKQSFYYLFYLLFSVVTIATFIMERTKLGYGLKAIGEDEITAEELGINVTKIKIIAFLIGASISGLVGALHALYLAYIDVPIFFSVFLTFVIMYVAILGGRGIWFGSLIGSILYVPVDEAIVLLTAIPEYSRIFYGLLFILVMLFMPEGIGGFIKRKIRGD